MRNQRDLIYEYDWDTIIILDACRYDYFDDVAQNYDLDYECVWSSGYDTGSWYVNTWNRKRYEDIILMSDNPVPWREGQGLPYKKFVKTFPIFTERGKTLNTFLPLEEVLDRAIDIHEKHKDKKILLHLIPPHLPYYHEEGMNFLFRLFKSRQIGGARLYTAVQTYGNNNGFEKLIEYYKMNIELPLQLILERDWKGKTIITADHGELIGEGGYYGHSIPHCSSEPILHKVPWMRMEND